MIRSISCIFALTLTGLGMASATAQHSAPTSTKSLAWTALPVDEPATAAEVAARERMTEALKRQGFHFSDDAPVLVDMGIADRSSDITLRDVKGATLLSAGRKRGLIASCKTKRIVRLNIQLTERTTGRALYSGGAQERHCDADGVTVLARLGDEVAADIGRTVR